MVISYLFRFNSRVNSREKCCRVVETYGTDYIYIYIYIFSLDFYSVFELMFTKSFSVILSKNASLISCVGILPSNHIVTNQNADLDFATY